MNDQIKEKRFVSWNTFKSTYNENLPLTDGADLFKYDFIYRGQRSASWGLTSSFDRLYENESIIEREQIFKRQLDIFKEEATKHGYLDANENETLIAGKAQHYGMPTRLLDWTYSPYVAAYFAYTNHLIDNKTSEDIAIWVLNKSQLQQLVHKSHLDIVDIVDAKNSRLLAQNGLFTRLISEHEAIEKLLVNDYPNSAWILKKFTLPCGEAKKALHDLTLMGITAKSLFPGIEGISKFSREKCIIMEE